MKVILKKTPLYESFDFDSYEDEDENFDVIIEFNKHKKFLESNYEIVGQVKPYKKDGMLFIDVDGDVMVKNKELTSLTEGRFCFGQVKGDFDCSNCNYLKSLEGAPKEVDGYFSCDNCESLISIKGSPKKVGDAFYCSNCDSLTSLKGAPKEVGGEFNCCVCPLTSLEGAPEKVGGDFYCEECYSLTSLKGAPKEVGGNFYCSYCFSLKSRVLPLTTKIKGEIIK